MQEVRRALKDDGEIFCDFRTQRDDMYCHSEKYGEFIEKDTLLLKKMFQCQAVIYILQHMWY